MVTTAGPAITDTHGNQWTITGGGQVAVNGAADTATSAVKELAYVNGQIWQENQTGLWREKAVPADAWAPSSGTAINPLPSSGQQTMALTSTTATISQDNLMITGSGAYTLFLQGSFDTVQLSGGTEAIHDSGHNNGIVLPAAGQGKDLLYGNVLGNGDTFDLRTALAATTWDGLASHIGQYLRMSTNNDGANAVLSIRSTPTGSFHSIAVFEGAGSVGLASLLTHAITH